MASSTRIKGIYKYTNVAFFGGDILPFSGVGLRKFCIFMGIKEGDVKGGRGQMNNLIS